MKNFIISFLIVLFIGMAGRVMNQIEITKIPTFDDALRAVMLIFIFWNAADINDIKRSIKEKPQPENPA